MGLTVVEFRDLDLMLKLAEQGSGATAKDLAAELGLGDNGVQHVATRFAWMRRYGMLELDERKRLWSLSDGGSRVAESHIRAAMTQVIDAVPDEAMVEVMAHITGRYRLGDPMVAAMLRREFQYGTSPRRR